MGPAISSGALVPVPGSEIKSYNARTQQSEGGVTLLKELNAESHFLPRGKVSTGHPGSPTALRSEGEPRTDWMLCSCHFENFNSFIIDLLFCKFYGLNCVPQNVYAAVLAPSTSECDLYKQGCCRCNQLR